MALAIDYPLVLIGLDPGGTTGVAAYRIKSEDSPAELLWTEQWGDRDVVVDKLLTIAATHWVDGVGSLVFASERFDKRPGVIEPDYSSMFIENEMRKRMTAHTVVWQTPSQAKNLVKPGRSGVPDALKRFGWYQPGNRHANDASRHAIVFLVEKLHHMPTILKGWPKRA